MNAENSPAARLDGFARAKLAELDAAERRRRRRPTRRGPGGRAERDGQTLISFCDNDYLGLTQHPALAEAAAQAARQWGSGAGAARLITGEHPLLGELEDRLARLKGTEAALIFGSGYLANLGIIPVLAGPGDLILIDALAHACMQSGAKLSGATVIAFAHNDTADLKRHLAAQRPVHRQALILTEGVFSMDGDLAPLPALSDLAQTFDAWLMTDDAHGLGVIGEGRGSAAHWGEAARVPLQMGTLSKAVGAYGGYLCASRAVIELMVNRARTAVFATALPPPVVASAIAGLDLIATDRALTARPLTLARRFAARVGLPEPASPIVPLILGAETRALAAAEALAAEGFLVAPIRPPTVPDGTARLRFTFSATHAEADVDRLAEGVNRLMRPR